jgi:hypothetical protein
MASNLNGYTIFNPLSLTGKSLCSKQSPSFIIHSIKTKVISQFLVPLFSNQWSILMHNALLIDKYLVQLNELFKKYKLDELSVYVELLKVIKIVCHEHSLLLDAENNFDYTKDPSNIVSMIYKTTSIRLLPEYEIYNSLYGRPSKEKKEVYNPDIINEIKHLLKKNHITYMKIKDYLFDKYPK